MMERKFFLRGFGNLDGEAVLTCFWAGIRIAQGTVRVFYANALSGKIDCPFVLETKEGELAAGGIYPDFKGLPRNYMFNSIMSCVRRNHERGTSCAITPIFSSPEHGQSLLVVTPVEYEDEIRNSDEDYARLEAYVNNWLDGSPKLFV